MAVPDPRRPRWPLRLSTRPVGWAALLMLATLACAPKAPPPPPPPDVTVAQAIGREITDWDEFSGRFAAVDQVEIRPRVAGYIQSVNFEEGHEVQKGELLFVIDPRPYQQELDRAQAQLDQAHTRGQLAQSELERAKKLVDVQAISREEFEARTSSAADNQAAVRAAEAAVATAKLNLEWTRVRSPIAGRVSGAEVREGNLVQSGPPAATLLTTVVSMDPIYVWFDGDEQTYLRYAGLAPGKQARGDERRVAYVGLANETGFPHPARIDFVDNHLDPVSGTIRARAVLPNAKRQFTPGLFARVRVVGSGKYSATLIQDGAVGTDQDKKFVFVIKPDNSVEYRPIQTGRLTDGLRVVKGGLQPGERIIINGLQRVRPGMKVTVHESPMVPDTTTATETRAASR